SAYRRFLVALGEGDRTHVGQVIRTGDIHRYLTGGICLPFQLEVRLDAATNVLGKLFPTLGYLDIELGIELRLDGQGARPGLDLDFVFDLVVGLDRHLLGQPTILAATWLHGRSSSAIDDGIAALDAQLIFARGAAETATLHLEFAIDVWRVDDLGVGE